jgi:hypothetical protein
VKLLDWLRPGGEPSSEHPNHQPKKQPVEKPKKQPPEEPVDQPKDQPDDQPNEQCGEPATRPLRGKPRIIQFLKGKLRLGALLHLHGQPAKPVFERFLGGSLPRRSLRFST